MTPPVEHPYGAIIVEHFRHPRNQRTLGAGAVVAEGVNPLCGDRVRVELAIPEGSAVVADAAFTANACAICVAAASLLTEHLRGLALHSVLGLADATALRWLEAPIPTGRERCALLPLETARRAVAVMHTGAGVDRRLP